MGGLGPRLSCPDPWGVATLFRGDRLGRGQHRGAALGSLMRKQAGNVTRRNPSEKLRWQRAASSPHRWPLSGVVSWGSQAGWGVGTEVLPGGGGPQQIPQVRGCSRVTPGAANRRLVELDAWGVSSRPEPPPDFSEPPFPLLQGESTIPI